MTEDVGVIERVEVGRVDEVGGERRDDEGIMGGEVEGGEREVDVGGG